MTLNGRDTPVTLHQNQRQLSGNACIGTPQYFQSF
jgi:hypothetical protein